MDIDNSSAFPVYSSVVVFSHLVCILSANHSFAIEHERP